jgi:hypothetical protein
VPVELPAGAAWSSTAICSTDHCLARATTACGEHLSISTRARNHYCRGSSPVGMRQWGFLDHRDICMVAGKHPYASKVTADLMHPHVRPDGMAAVPENAHPTKRRYRGRTVRVLRSLAVGAGSRIWFGRCLRFRRWCCRCFRGFRTGSCSRFGGRRFARLLRRLSCRFARRRL